MSVDVREPPPARHTGPIIDAHCHFTTPAATERMLRAGRRFGVTRWIGICGIHEVPPLRKRFGPEVGFSIWLDHEHTDDARRFVETNRRIIERAVRQSCHCIKFWYKPEFNRRSGFYFDDPRLDPIFTDIINAGLPVLVHIADPDVWWRHQYRDAERFERKRFTYRQLTNTLGRFPDLRVLVAHMGGWPENLPFLDDLLHRHRNAYLDTSATKWVARELSAQPAAARAFIIRNADRLLFGSDLVAFKRATFEHHCSRYWVHRHLYEQAGVVPSPIPDPDAPGPVFVAGLDLPKSVLDRLYLTNATAFFRAVS